MKKVMSIVLALAMLFSLCGFAFASDTKAQKTMSFNAEGKFKIMQINDIQDTDKMNKRTVEFLKAALESEKPDLVVVVGDTLSERFTAVNAKKIKEALRVLGRIFEEAKTPFALTFGNHDHDLEDVVSTADMMAVLDEFSYFVRNEGCDPGTYNIPVMSNDGSKMALNVYIMDSNNKDGAVSGYSGCYKHQVEWYNQKSAELKAQNGGKVVPSVLFQHVPVKEIYQFLEQVPVKDANRAVFSLNDYKWYVLKDEYILDKENALFGEAPCSESFESDSGEYDAWVRNGDIIGAFFGHDHVNNFVGKTDDGIVMAYNGGTGFRAYGSGDKRAVRILEFDQNAVEDYTTRVVFYRDLCEKISYYPTDFMSTAIFGDILRFIFRLFFITSWQNN